MIFADANAVEVAMVKPVEASFSENQSIDLGEGVRGEVLDFIFVSKQSNDLRFDRVEALSLPEGWGASKSEFFGETLGMSVVIPKEEELGIKHLRLKLIDSSSNQSVEFASTVFVKSKLVSGTITPLKQETIVGSKAYYDISLLNDSIADHLVWVSSDLPNFWFREKLVRVKAKSLEELRLEVEPKTYGMRSFNFTVTSAMNGSNIATFPGELVVNPTIESKFASGFYGIPFFSLSLQPFYLINAFVSMFLE